MIPKANLPEIIKRGPINNQKNNTKRVVGLSLQKRDEPQPRAIRPKRGSLESTTVKSHRNSKARNAVIRAQHDLDVPKVKAKPVSRAYVPTYRMPNR